MDFVSKIFPLLERKDDIYLTLPSNYEQRFMVLWKKWETETKKQAGAKKMKTFAETSKGKEFQDKKGQPKKKKRSQKMMMLSILELIGTPRKKRRRRMISKSRLVGSSCERNWPDKDGARLSKLNPTSSKRARRKRNGLQVLFSAKLKIKSARRTSPPLTSPLARKESTLKTRKTNTLEETTT